MIDVHVIHMPGENQAWWNTCHNSLTQHNINIHHVDGIIGDVRKARHNGFLCGNAEYVSFVDPDDIVLPGSFSVLETVIQQNPDACGVYSTSEMITETGKSKGLIHPYRAYAPSYLNRHILEIHQLVVMRRDIVLRTFEEYYDILPLVGYTELVLYACMALKHHWVAVDYVGYQWRMRGGGSHRVDGAQSRTYEALMRSLYHRLLLTHY